MNSGDEEALLRHLAAFGLTTKAVVSRRSGQRGIEVLESLVASKRVLESGQLRNGQTFYQLPEGAKRARPSEQLYLFLAFCELTDIERRPIAPARIQERYPDFNSRALHCIENGEPPRIWRVYTPTSAHADIQTARHIRQAYWHSQHRLTRESTLRELVAAGNYGFAVLLNDEKRAAYLRKLLSDRALPREIAVLVEIIA